jgi:hypothetical protein
MWKFYFDCERREAKSAKTFGRDNGGCVNNSSIHQAANFFIRFERKSPVLQLDNSNSLQK